MVKHIGIKDEVDKWEMDFIHQPKDFVIKTITTTAAPCFLDELPCYFKHYTYISKEQVQSQTWKHLLRCNIHKLLYCSKAIKSVIVDIDINDINTMLLGYVHSP